MKRNLGKRLLATGLTLLMIFSLLVIPASASNYTDAYNRLVALAKTGYFYSGSDDILEGEHYYSIGHEYHIPDWGYLAEIYFVAYTTLDHLELRVGCNERWVWVIVPKTPGTPWEIKGVNFENIVSRGSVLIDPATYKADTELTLSAFQGDEAFREAMLNRIKIFWSRMLDYTSLELAKMGYTLADLGFVHYSANDAHYWQVVRGEGAGCFTDGYADRVCMYCGEQQHIILPAYGTHDWKFFVTDEAPSCTQQGQDIYSCSRCGKEKYVTVPALGHTWTYTETLTPTEGENHGTALYTCSRCQETKEDRLCAGVVFTDMPADDYWAHVPIDWAYFGGITSGKTPTSFAPKANITRAEAVTFLWTLAGRPEPAAAENPFADVGADKYYYKPVLWAVEQGITSGKSETSFAPKAQCSRAEIMTFLWNAAGRPAPELAENPFTDVPEGKYYYDPILWAYEQHVTGGATATTFGPRNVCTRAQVVTFLYKAQDLLRPAAPEPEPEPEPQPEPLPEPDPLPEP